MFSSVLLGFFFFGALLFWTASQLDMIGCRLVLGPVFGSLSAGLRLSRKLETCRRANRQMGGRERLRHKCVTSQRLRAAYASGWCLFFFFFR